METIEIIIECNTEKERLIAELGKIKYALPMINSYVIEINKEDLFKLNGIKGIKAVHQNAHITAQMNIARKIVKAEKAQSMGLTGKNIGVAVLDTGIAPVDDLTKPKNRIVAFKNFTGKTQEPYDDNGHGTHVCGIICGNGYNCGGKYMGIAPNANLVGAKILDASGKGGSAEVLAGLQWIMDNRKKYNIRICNLSIGTADAGQTDPLVKAVNAAWDAGIVIVIAAGNNGPSVGSVTSPGISRKVITVGASDDHMSVQIWGDTLVNFSGRGPTLECIVKPDVIAPGSDITSCLSPQADKEVRENSETDIVSQNYIKMSGTSMSTPIVTGGIALLLERYPSLTPDDVKYMIKQSSVNLNYSANQQGWGLIDIEKLVQGEAIYVRK